MNRRYLPGHRTVWLRSRLSAGLPLVLVAGFVVVATPAAARLTMNGPIRLGASGI